MKKVYGICSGEYSDWGIDYMFESEEMRNKVLEKLNYGKEESDYDFYEEIDYDLDDKNFDLNKCKNISFVECEYIKAIETNKENFELKIKKANTLISKEQNFNHGNYEEWFNRNEIKISKVLNNNENIDEQKLKNKFLKICRDYYAKAQYIKQTDGLDEFEISRMLFK